MDDKGGKVSDRREYNQSYYQKNKERLKQRERERYQENKEAKKEYARNYRKENKDKVNACNRSWNKRNRERVNEQNRQRYWDNHERYLEMSRKSNQRRRARKTVTDGYEPSEIFKRDNWKCQLCGEKTERKAIGQSEYNPKKPTIDHIKSLNEGGTDTWGNVQTACFSCNLSKGPNTQGQMRLEVLLNG